MARSLRKRNSLGTINFRVKYMKRPKPPTFAIRSNRV